ncbi:MAG: hypothetical protein ACYC2G_10040, partial [Gemmatimonadaceae bacterium]
MVMALATFAGVATAQRSPKAEVLTNASVIEMVGAKLPEDIIIAKIQTSRSDFDLSTKELAHLTGSDVPSSIIKAMMQSGSALAASPAPAKSTRKVVSLPSQDVPSDPGLYIYADLGEG